MAESEMEKRIWEFRFVYESGNKKLQKNTKILKEM
jgi:hypothetical protein